MKKIYILIALIFLLCGCNATVNLDVSEKRISEEIIVDTSNDKTFSKEMWASSFRNYIPVYNTDVIADTEPDEPVKGVKYYEKTAIESGTGYIFNYSYIYSFDSYKNSRSLKNGFKSYNLIKNTEEKTLTLSTDKSGLQYFDKYIALDKVKINIHTDYKVIDSNSDSNNNGTYTWNLTKKDNKNIYLVMQYEENTNNNGNGNNSNNNNENTNQNNNKNKKKEQKEQTEAEKFMSKHPVLIGILAIVSFIFFVLLLRKIVSPK